MAVTPTGSISGTWRTVASGGRSDITDNKAPARGDRRQGCVPRLDYEVAYTHAEFNWSGLPSAPASIVCGLDATCGLGSDQRLVPRMRPVKRPWIARSCIAWSRRRNRPPTRSISVCRAKCFTAGWHDGLAFGGSYARKPGADFDAGAGQRRSGRRRRPIPSVSGRPQGGFAVHRGFVPLTKTLEASGGALRQLQERLRRFLRPFEPEAGAALPAEQGVSGQRFAGGRFPRADAV